MLADEDAVVFLEADTQESRYVLFLLVSQYIESAPRANPWQHRRLRHLAGSVARYMDTSNGIAPSRDSEDALEVLGRVADAFDNPPLHRADKDPFFVVNVVKSRRLLASLSTKDSMCRDTTYGSYDSSFDASDDDDDVELVELGDVSVWEHAGSYPYASGRCQSHEPRRFSERMFRKDNGTCGVTQMLLTSSPLDRLDRLARMELKKSGWFERADKWSVVKMGLQGAATPPRMTSKSAGFCAGRFSSTKTVLARGERQTECSQTGGGQSRGRRAHGQDTEQDRYQGDTIKSDTPTPTPADYLADFVTLPYGCAPCTPVRTSRLSRTFLPRQTSEQHARGRFGQAVRNFVKRMLPPSPGGGVPVGHVKSARACTTPGSDASGESGWTFGSASGWVETRCRECRFWHESQRWQL